jgi:murein DD-endopeptidase MepM/ murein hydrolase activator NlpD
MMFALDAITSDRKKAVSIYQDQYTVLFANQSKDFQDTFLNQIIQNERDLYYTIFQIQETRAFLEEREKIISSTPSTWPVQGQITSLYGYRRDPLNFLIQFHAAIDIAAAKGTAVIATAPGVVVTNDKNKYYGNFIILSHKYGFYTLYAHNSEILVQLGDQVHHGQVIAKIGRTGRTTGNHLHYEVHIGNKSVNPYNYIFRQ